MTHQKSPPPQSSYAKEKPAPPLYSQVPPWQIVWPSHLWALWDPVACRFPNGKLDLRNGLSCSPFLTSQFFCDGRVSLSSGAGIDRGTFEITWFAWETSAGVPAAILHCSTHLVRELIADQLSASKSEIGTRIREWLVSDTTYSYRRWIKTGHSMISKAQTAESQDYHWKTKYPMISDILQISGWKKKRKTNHSTISKFSTQESKRESAKGQPFGARRHDECRKTTSNGSIIRRVYIVRSEKETETLLRLKKMWSDSKRNQRIQD